MIEYDTYIIDQNKANDRISDMNCFWMATDVDNPENLFENSEERHGKFSNYDGLRLYYIGVGGHDNSKTRFRRYTGNGKRPLLDEHDFSRSEYLLEPNETYHIVIVAFDNFIQYYRNGDKMIDFYDEHPYTKGHFGLRTVNNHMTVDNFKVYKLAGSGFLFSPLQARKERNTNAKTKRLNFFMSFCFIRILTFLKGQKYGRRAGI